MQIIRELNMVLCPPHVVMVSIYRLYSNKTLNCFNVMKRIKKSITGRMQITIICCCSILMTTCTKHYAEINTDRNTVATVGSAELPFLFAKAEESSIPNVWNYQVA